MKQESATILRNNKNRGAEIQPSYLKRSDAGRLSDR